MSGKSQEGFFKIKHTKRSNPEERTTLDVIHQYHLKRIQDEYQESHDIQQDCSILQRQINDTQDDLVRGQLENQLVRLNEELVVKQNTDRLYDYLLDTGDLLFNYYDIQDKISQGATGAITQRSRHKPGDVLSALKSAQELDESNIHEDVDPKQERKGGYPRQKEDRGLSRDMLLEQYLLKINPEYEFEFVDSHLPRNIMVAYIK